MSNHATLHPMGLLGSTLQALLYTPRQNPTCRMPWRRSRPLRMRNAAAVPYETHTDSVHDATPHKQRQANTATHLQDALEALTALAHEECLLEGAGAVHQARHDATRDVNTACAYVCTICVCVCRAWVGDLSAKLQPQQPRSNSSNCGRRR